jgi:ribose/xylose/arabinose/galactoside ABC-type transport system permease subunit
MVTKPGTRPGREADRTAPLASRLRPRTAQQLNEIGLFVAIVILFIVLAATATGFTSTNNQLGILRTAATVGIVAWGMTFVIIAGEIDISIGPAVAFTSVIMATAVADWSLSLPIAIVLAIVLATALGTFAGSLRAFFNVPSFIATLGLWSALRGLALFMTDALPVPLPTSGLLDLLAGDILGIPTPAVVMLILFAVFTFVARKTAYGRSVFAVGGNANAARLSGINVRRIRVLLFATNGLLVGLTGVLLAARLGSGNGGAASGLEFDAIAAVVIGGTALTGGRGSMLGTLLGVIFIALIGNGLILLGVNPFFQDVVRGVIIVAAVLINVLLGRRRETAGAT